jgi:hypothetical protein
MDGDQQIAGFGDVDGEVPNAALLKITGSGMAERAMMRGERVVITVIGTVSGLAFQEKNGVLTRTHTIVAENMAEAIGDLAEEVTDFLTALEDERNAREQLPLEEPDEDE